MGVSIIKWPVLRLSIAYWLKNYYFFNNRKSQNKLPSIKVVSFLDFCAIWRLFFKFDTLQVVHISNNLCLSYIKTLWINILFFSPTMYNLMQNDAVLTKRNAKSSQVMIQVKKYRIFKALKLTFWYVLAPFFLTPQGSVVEACAHSFHA